MQSTDEQLATLNRKANILIGLMVVIGLISLGLCTASVNRDPENLSDEQLARQTQSMADSLMANPAYSEYLQQGFDYDALVAAYMANPEYNEYLREPATTPEEDCAAIILSAVTMAHIPMLPDDEVDQLCDWYTDQLGPATYR